MQLLSSKPNQSQRFPNRATPLFGMNLNFFSKILSMLVIWIEDILFEMCSFFWIGKNERKKNENERGKEDETDRDFCW